MKKIKIILLFLIVCLVIFNASMQITKNPIYLTQLHTGKTVCSNICIENGIELPCDCNERINTNWTIVGSLMIWLPIILAGINCFIPND